MASFDNAEEARDSLQKELNVQDPVSFPVNGQFTDMAQLITCLLEDTSGNRIRYTRQCMTCNAKDTPLFRSPTWNLPVQSSPRLLSAEIKHRLSKMSSEACKSCGAKKVKEEYTINHHDPPPFIALGLEDRREMGEGACQPKLTATVSIGEKGDKVTYKLRGLVYWNGTHFTCRMIGKAGEVYYNDGMISGATSIQEGPLAKSALRDVVRETIRHRRLSPSAVGFWIEPEGKELFGVRVCKMGSNVTMKPGSYLASCVGVLTSVQPKYDIETGQERMASNMMKMLEMKELDRAPEQGF
ncbi:hypothetical protein PENSPDRAFT_671092 [Peniophora sp. CONT]|nr:hypothetical protein PENSPDRAFT_671092 [Peniophora sp. CONT]